jgi:hypothetical protein
MLIQCCLCAMIIMTNINPTVNQFEI